MQDKTTCCIECKSHNIEYVTKEEVFKVFDDNITVPSSYWVCHDCKEEFVNICAGNDPLLTAYNMYREKYNMLMPDEMKSIREKLKFSHEEMAEAIYLDKDTIMRYERGGLQTREHDNLYRKADLLHTQYDVYSVALMSPPVKKNQNEIFTEWTKIIKEQARMKLAQNDCFRKMFETV